jgi:hypothetical protein
MNDDLELAALLGEAPRTPDPAFRFDVFAATTARARRRAARRRALLYVAASAGVGLAFPVAQALGITLAAAAPFLLTAGALGLAYALAVLALEGAGGLLQRSLRLVRV